MLLHRILSALIMIPVTIGAVYVGFPFIDNLAIIVACFMAWEWDYLLKSKTNNCAIITAVVATICILLGTYIGYFSFLYVLIGMIASYLVARRVNPERAVLQAVGVAYVSVSLLSLIVLRSIGGYQLIFLIFGIVWGMDTGGYLFGSTIKGPKLCKKISPSKTWAGLIGGMIFASIAGAIYAHIYKFDYLPLVLVSAFLAVVSQAGDLFESHIKRKMEVKDSSNLIPGHGGILDRIDGLIFVAPTVLVIFICLEEARKYLVR